MRLLPPHLFRPGIENNERRIVPHHFIKLLGRDPILREPSTKLHAPRPSIRQKRTCRHREHIERGQPIRAHEHEQISDFSIQDRAAEHPRRSPKRRPDQIPKHEHAHIDLRRPQQRRRHQPQPRHELRQRQQRHAKPLEPMPRGTQSSIERKREPHERVQKPPAIQPPGGEPKRIGDHHRDNRSGKHVPKRSQTGRNQSAGQHQHGCSGNGNAKLSREDADEHGPRAPRRHNGDRDVRQFGLLPEGTQRRVSAKTNKRNQNSARTRNFILKLK